MTHDATPRRIVYSVGHGSLAIDEFLGQLERFEIRFVADVRRYPASRRHPQFTKAAFAQSLGAAGIGYAPLGEDLGGYREGSYEDHVRTPSFERGRRALERLARESTTAFLCAEKYPFRCHRRLIAEALERRGWEVRHVADGALLIVA